VVGEGPHPTPPPPARMSGPRPSLRATAGSGSMPPEAWRRAPCAGRPKPGMASNLPPERRQQPRADLHHLQLLPGDVLSCPPPSIPPEQTTESGIIPHHGRDDAPRGAPGPSGHDRRGREGSSSRRSSLPGLTATVAAAPSPGWRGRRPYAASMRGYRGHVRGHGGSRVGRARVRPALPSGHPRAARPGRGHRSGAAPTPLRAWSPSSPGEGCRCRSPLSGRTSVSYT
jgi:hypothetical protein